MKWTLQSHSLGVEYRMSNSTYQCFSVWTDMPKSLVMSCRKTLIAACQLEEKTKSSTAIEYVTGQSSSPHLVEKIWIGVRRIRVEAVKLSPIVIKSFASRNFTGSV